MFTLGKNKKNIYIFFVHPSLNNRESATTTKKCVFYSNNFGRKCKMFKTSGNLQVCITSGHLTCSLITSLAGHLNTAPAPAATATPPGVCIIKQLYRRSSAGPWLAHLARDLDEHVVYFFFFVYCKKRAIRLQEFIS